MQGLFYLLHKCNSHYPILVSDVQTHKVSCRQISESEKIARSLMPITNDQSMMKVCGDSTIYPGAVAVIRANLEKHISKTKTPFKMLRNELFGPGYVATRVLSGTTRGGCMVCDEICPRPKLVWV